MPVAKRRRTDEVRRINVLIKRKLKDSTFILNFIRK